MSINLNYWYNLGSVLGLLLVIQIITGIFLSMYYIANVDLAFNSIQYIKREVLFGNIIQSLHANGAFFLFIALYLHISRALKFTSYIYSNIGAWYIGIILFFLMIITAFLGYSLPFGNMSLWAIAVITNLLSIIPYFGKDIVTYIYGGYNIDNSTLGRFYTLHFLLPFIIIVFSILHLVYLHFKGGSNPLGIHSVKNLGNVNFHPYYTYKDILGLLFIFLFYYFIVFYYPDYFGHSDNNITANPLVTPSHIVPEAYLLPFYSILRAIPNKTLGVIALLSSIFVLFLLPFSFFGLFTSELFLPIYRLSLYYIYTIFMLLIYSGGAIVSEPFISFSQILAIAYFVYFIFDIPIISFSSSLFYNSLFRSFYPSWSLAVLLDFNPILNMKKNIKEYRDKVIEFINRYI